MQTYIIELMNKISSSTLAKNERGKLLELISLIKEDIYNVLNDPKLNKNQKNCFMQAYFECIRNICTCYWSLKDFEEFNTSYQKK